MVLADGYNTSRQRDADWTEFRPLLHLTLLYRHLLIAALAFLDRIQTDLSLGTSGDNTAG